MKKLIPKWDLDPISIFDRAYAWDDFDTESLGALAPKTKEFFRSLAGTTMGGWVPWQILHIIEGNIVYVLFRGTGVVHGNISDIAETPFPYWIFEISDSNIILYKTKPETARSFKTVMRMDRMEQIRLSSSDGSILDWCFDKVSPLIKPYRRMCSL